MTTATTASSNRLLGAVLRQALLAARAGLLLLLLTALGWAAAAPDATAQTCQLCVGSGKVSHLVLRYTGTTGATIRVDARKGNNVVTIFNAFVPAGGAFPLSPPSDPDFQNTLGNDVRMYINGAYNSGYHTSCSVAIWVGKRSSVVLPDQDQSGAFVVLGGSHQSGNQCTIADLEIKASSNPDANDPPPQKGDPLVFTVNLFNNPNSGDPFGTFFGGSVGPAWTSVTTANSVTVKSTLSSELQYTGASCSVSCTIAPPGAGPGGTVTFSNLSVAVGSTITFTINTTVAAQGTASLVSEVTTSDKPDPDSTPANCGSTTPWNPPTPLAPKEDDCFGLILAVLPVELVAFDATLDGRSATLRWQTASETNNAGFEIQHRYKATADKAASAFEALAFVDGHGTTLEAQNYQYRIDALQPGRHVFRLKQLDYDGSYEYSPEVEVAVEMPEAYVFSAVYPNPFNPQATFSFGVRQSQQVEIGVYNLLGQRVLALYRGVPEAGVTRTLEIDGSGLRSGVYVVRVLGETFVDTQTITLIK